MTAKSQALIKEIAALFVKYSLADWSPVINELENGGRGKIAEAVRDLASVSAPSRPKPITKQKSPAKQAPSKSVANLINFSAERSKYLEPLLQAMKKRVVAPTTSDMRELYFAIGIKNAFPKRREEAAEAIALRLDKLPDEQFQKIIAEVERLDNGVEQRPDDYERWFKLILDHDR